jgi:hypothetical protein
MKRSKLFLAGTACLLAIAGVAATKAHNIAHRNVFYTSSNNHCTAVKATSCSLGGGGGVCRTGTSTSRTLYTVSSTSVACHQITLANTHIAKYNSQ